MNGLRRMTALLLALTVLLSLAACGGKQEGTVAPETEEKPGVTLNVATMTGPTGMGLAYLLDTFGTVETPQEEPLGQAVTAQGNSFNFMLAATADEITPLLIKGELDIACVPANLASVLYNKTQGGIVTLGINTLGVLYVVEKGETVQFIADLAGKTIVSAGKGSVPEYGLRYLLAQNGMDPDTDLTMEWKSEQSECVAALASGAADIAVMPQPYVTVAQGKVEGLRVAVSLTEEWEALNNGSSMLTGVVVARREVVENYPEVVQDFLTAYEASVEFVQNNTAEAAEIIGNYGIVAAAVAEQALPHCNIVCITGEEMREKLSGYLEVLFEQEPAAVGGALPGEDFYWVPADSIT